MSDLSWVNEMKEKLSRGVPAGVNPLEVKMEERLEPAIEYVRIERPKYVAEVGKRDGSYVYHFWPRERSLLDSFDSKLSDAFLKVFKVADRVSSKHDEVIRCSNGEKEAEAAEKAGHPIPLKCGFWGTREDFTGDVCPNCEHKSLYVSMSSWAVKVIGYADNPLADDLAGSVFNTLDGLL